MLALAWVAMLAGCTPGPTPYQPLMEDYGFEETRLQPRVYKVAFKANPYTKETDVLDYMYLRSAELTKRAGFTHFLIQQDYGKSQNLGRPRARVSIGMGFFSGVRGNFWGAGGHVPLGSDDYGPRVAYHLGVFIIRMLTLEESRQEPESLEVDFLMQSIRGKIASRAKKAS